MDAAIVSETSSRSSKCSMDSEEAIKAAKKVLKKSDGMKMKKLVKKMNKKLGSNGIEEDLARSWIENSGEFVVEEKVVRIKRKIKDEKQSKKKKRKVSPENEFCTWRKEHSIVLKGGASEDEEELNKDPSYKPFTEFDCPNIEQTILDIFIKEMREGMGFSKPTAVQAQCWPLLHLQGSSRRDVVGIAQTGSGKTLAFALPALGSMARDKKSRKHARMLVLAPTRELAMQSHEVIAKFAKLVNLASVVIYGGDPKHKQLSQLRTKVDCIIATPGRLKDLIQNHSLDLSHVSHLVLDEADRMLDLGFEQDVRFIISKTKPSHQRKTNMFSATWPHEIQQLANDFMLNPIQVIVGSQNTQHTDSSHPIHSLSANKQIKQIIEVIQDQHRLPRLQHLLKNTYHKSQKNRIIIFALYKKEAHRLQTALHNLGFHCNSIHGDKSQKDRTNALQSFKSGDCPLLIATDVAARGLDIPDVEVVLNYTFPLTIEDYVHRIGRTGRAGKTGISYTFFQPTDKANAGALQHILRQADQPIPKELLDFGSTIKKKEHKLYGNFGPKHDPNVPVKKAVKITFDSDHEFD